MKHVLLATLLLSSLPAFAKAPISQNMKNHLTITSIEVTDLTDLYNSFESSNSDEAILNTTPFGRALTLADVVVDKVINIGQKVWNVVEKGRPVSNYSKSTGSALPARTLRWDQLENWSAPKSRVIGVSYKNLLGFEVVHFVYRIVLVYGGDVDGVGRYIGYTTVEPLQMTTAYMYTFNAKVSVESVYNMGSSQNPVAGMLLNVSWTVETVMKKEMQSHNYSLDGKGNILTL